MINQSNNYPSLTKCYKNFYPFKIGTTSFIYPDSYVPNVKMLGPFVDEIELLLFESDPVASLLSKSVINDLKQLSQELKLTFNVHLPIDISISDPNPVKQERAINTLVNIIERVAPLSPSSHTLHVPYSADLTDDDHLNKWQDVVYRNLEKIIYSGVPQDKIAIETLDYSFELVDDIIVDLNLKICMDLGHLIVHGYDIKKVFNKYAFRTSIIHLHGVENDHDHLTLERLPIKLIEPVLRILKRFTGVVSLEIFSFKDLNSSLKFLENHWEEN